MHSAGHVTAENSRPLLNEDAHFRHMPVEGVDGDGGVLDDDLVGTDKGHWCFAYLEGGVGFLEPRGLVGGHFC